VNTDLAQLRELLIQFVPSATGPARAPGASRQRCRPPSPTTRWRTSTAICTSSSSSCGRRAASRSTNLDPDRFVRALRRERAELIRKHASRDARFHLAFQNGRAAIRFTTVA
jgi:hypothetical protein